MGVSFPPVLPRRLPMRLLEGKVRHISQEIPDPQLLSISLTFALCYSDLVVSQSWKIRSLYGQVFPRAALAKDGFCLRCGGGPARIVGWIGTYGGAPGFFAADSQGYRYTISDN